MNKDWLDLDDARWATFLGGYRVPYDPRGALDALEQEVDVPGAWDELWNELHHQGDIGEAAYAALPHIVEIHELRGVADWNTYAIAATIELARDNPNNPAIPVELSTFYDVAWQRLVRIGLREFESATDETLVTSILAVLAIGKGLRTLGFLAVEFNEDGRRGWIRMVDEMNAALIAQQIKEKFPYLGR